MSAVFSAGGLASGLDWTSMIDKMVQLESRPLDLLRNQQTALRSQVSLLGEVTSKLSALKTAADALSDSGAVAVKTVGTNTSFSAEPGSNAVAGRYTIEVDNLAKAAKARSDGFASTDTVRGGTLALRVGGEDFTAVISDGSSLADAAEAIRTSGAPVNIMLLNDGTNAYLSLTNRDTGYPIGSDPGDALLVNEISTGSQGKPLAIATTQEAENAVIQLDGVTLTRTSNVISDAVPGTTLTLATEGGDAEELVLENDPTGTAENIQNFITAYNDVIQLTQRQLDVSETSSRKSTLAGDSTIRHLQLALQSMMTREVGSSTVRSLADIGIETARDGTISLDSDTLADALSRDTNAVNELFSNATSGIGVAIGNMVDTYTSSSDGLLTIRTNSLNSRVSQMDEQADNLSIRIENYRKTLIMQFTAMEETISGLQATGRYLEQQSGSD